MIRDKGTLATIAVLLATGCSFDLAAMPDGGNPGDDAGPLPPTVGFSQPTSTQDESSGAVMITVQLSEPAPAAVTVDYSFGGDATLGTDYTATAGALVFGVGETTKTIDLTILADSNDELEETVVISLDSATGATLAATTHTMSIAASTLPRVNLSVAASSVDEQTPVMITFTLTKPADGPVSVSYTAGGGTALPAGTPLYADYALAPGIVMFPQGSVMQTLPLGVVNDTRNELSETLDITLTTTTGVVIGTTGTQTHTIVDNDTAPSIRFSVGSTSTPEGSTGTSQVLITVTLSAASGRTITAPISVETSSTAGNPADYTLVGSSVTFVEGVTSQDYIVNVVGDGINEVDEDLNLNLAAPADLSATLGAQSDRRLRITNDDLWCVGSGTYAICYLDAPTAPTVLPISINTTNSPLCKPQPSGWTQQNVCVITGTTITMAGATVVIGGRPLVLAASGSISISQTLDAASHFGAGGTAPAAPAGGGACKSFVVTPGNNNSGGGGGGAGASFMSKGGDGGVGSSTEAGGTSAAADVTPPATLRAGCDGQRGGAANGNMSGPVGRGGGAVYLVAGTSITITSTINVSGSAADAGADNSGGSGAGTGGMIVLSAPVFSVTGAVLMANGGGGAGGGSNNTPGTPGFDPLIATPFVPALGGLGTAGGFGGQGHAGSTAPSAGQSPGNNRGGGGGGGGGGYIKANLALTGAMVSAGLVQAP